MAGEAVLPETVRAMIALAIERVRPRRIVLFGSWARGENNSASDIDLAFDIDPERQLEWLRFVTDMDELPITLQPVDYVELSTVDSAMRAEIEREGVVLCGG